MLVVSVVVDVLLLSVALEPSLVDIVAGAVNPPLLDVTSLADPSLPAEQAANETAESKIVILSDMESRYVARDFFVNAAKRATQSIRTGNERRALDREEKAKRRDFGRLQSTTGDHERAQSTRSHRRQGEGVRDAHAALA